MDKDLFYTCTSGMQKAIRRGNPDLAVASGLVVWAINPFYCYRRIVTIIFEDCGRDHELAEYLYYFYRKGRSYKDRDDVAELIERCARAKKSQDTSYVSATMERKDLGTLPEFQERAVASFLSQDIWDRVKARKESNEDIVRDLMGGSYLVAWAFDELQPKVDRERQSTSYPLYHLVDGGKTLGTMRNQLEGIKDPIVDDLMYAAALDGHTLYGKKSHGIIRSRYRDWFDERNYSCKDLSIAEFDIWSSGLSAAVVDEGSPESNVADAVLREKPNAELRNWVVDHIEELVDIKLWVLGKDSPGFFQRMASFVSEVVK